MRVIHDTPWYGFVLIFLSFAAGALLIGIVFTGSSRIKENKDLVAEIQTNRVASCRQTYESYIEVFRPFFPSGRPTKQNKRWAPEQRKNWGKLTGTVERLKGRCDEQVNNLKEE
jgi:hypothetical protein